MRAPRGPHASPTSGASCATAPRCSGRSRSRSLFVVLFGSIFSGGGSDTGIGLGRPGRHAARGGAPAGFAENAAARAHRRHAEESTGARCAPATSTAVIVVPAGPAAVIVPSASGSVGAPVAVAVFTDPSQSTTRSDHPADRVGQVMGANLRSRAATARARGRRPSRSRPSRPHSAAYFVPSILAMALMQLGVFAAIPLVRAAREAASSSGSKRRRCHAGHWSAATS